jgi:hypothetical protein
MRKLTETLTGAEGRIDIDYRAPSVHISATEMNLGETLKNQPLTSAMITALGRRGVRFTNTADEADLHFKVNANTIKSDRTQGFYTSTLDLNIEVIESISGETVYKMVKNDVKGVDLNYEKAGMKAYQNITRNIESELMRNIASSLF